VELEGQTFKSIIMMCLDLPYKEHMLCASRVDLLGGIIPNYTTFIQTFHSSFWFVIGQIIFSAISSLGSRFFGHLELLIIMQQHELGISDLKSVVNSRIEGSFLSFVIGAIYGSFFSLGIRSLRFLNYYFFLFNLHLFALILCDFLIFFSFL
jgi:hypothetical protein